MIEYGDKWGKPAVFVGIGVESLTRPESQAIMRQRIVPLAAYWTVRSATDRQRLLDHGVRTDRVTVAADMAWLIPSADLAFGRDVLRPHLGAGRPLIAVNVNAETAVLERAPAMLASLAHALDSLIERHGVRVIFLFNEIRKGPTYDVAAANKVKSLMRRADAAFAVPEIYFSPAQTMSILGNCALAISTRYHVCIFAALQGVPFMALKRSDKIYDLCSDLAWNYGAAVEAVTGAEIANQADILLSSPEPVLRHLAARVQAMKARARNNLKGLDELRSVAGQVKPGAGLLRALNSTLSVGSRPG
jgi:polysaccharide pyruvyl transferase WcaK-like protein